MFSFNAADEVDELYVLGDGRILENLWDDESYGAILDEAVARLHARLVRDERWKSYRGFLELTYPEKLAASGDRQLFF